MGKILKTPEELYQIIREYVRENQSESSGLRLDEISEGTGIKEEMILHVLSEKAIGGQLQGTDIIVSFME